MAQSGPAELPPEDFEGRQYIDSTGCIYLRKTSESGTVWEPRTLSEGEIMCGFAPTFPFLEPKDGSDPQDQVVVVPKTPAETSDLQSESETGVEEQPAIDATSTAEMPKPADQKPEPEEAPVLESEVAETKEAEETDEILAFPKIVKDASTVTAETQPEPIQETAPEETANAQPATSEAAVETPAELPTSSETASVVPQTAPTAVEVAEPKPEMSPQPVAPEAVSEVDWSKGTYLQIAAFRQRENTLKTKAVIEELGLPIAIEAVQSQGRPLEVVLVGPFSDSEASKAALRAVRKAGYNDAFTRKN